MLDRAEKAPAVSNNLALEALQDESYLERFTNFAVSRHLSSNPETQRNIDQMGSLFLRTGAYFLPGSGGLVATVATGALGRARPSDSIGSQAADAILGGTSSALTRGLFGLSTSIEAPMMRGLFVGMGARTLETVTDRRNYIDPTTGKFNFEYGYRKTIAAAQDRHAITADLLTFGALGGTQMIMSGLGGTSALGNFLRNPLTQQTAAGIAFGATTGAYGEVVRQNQAGERFDPLKVLEVGATHGAVTGSAALTAGLLHNGMVAWSHRNQRPIPTIDEATSATKTSWFAKDSDIVRRYDELRDSVVRIETMLNGNKHQFGSGFIVAEDGTIVTNQHVVKDGTSFRVRFQDGTTYDATSVVSAPAPDLAVLRITGEHGPFKPISLPGNPQVPAVGTSTLAFGYPDGSPTLHVSPGKMEAPWLYDPKIQIAGKPAPSLQYTVLESTGDVHPGNSGGPMITTLDGRLAGVVVMRNMAGGGSDGVAIPALKLNQFMRSAQLKFPQHQLLASAASGAS